MKEARKGYSKTILKGIWRKILFSILAKDDLSGSDLNAICTDAGFMATVINEDFKKSKESSCCRGLVYATHPDGNFSSMHYLRKEGSVMKSCNAHGELWFTFNVFLEFDWLKLYWKFMSANIQISSLTNKVKREGDSPVTCNRY